MHLLITLLALGSTFSLPVKDKDSNKLIEDEKSCQPAENHEITFKLPLGSTFALPVKDKDSNKLIEEEKSYQPAENHEITFKLPLGSTFALPVKDNKSIEDEKSCPCQPAFKPATKLSNECFTKIHIPRQYGVHQLNRHFYPKIDVHGVLRHDHAIIYEVMNSIMMNQETILDNAYTRTNQVRPGKVATDFMLERGKRDSCDHSHDGDSKNECGCNRITEPVENIGKVEKRCDCRNPACSCAFHRERPLELIEDEAFIHESLLSRIKGEQSGEHPSAPDSAPTSAPKYSPPEQPMYRPYGYGPEHGKRQHQQQQQQSLDFPNTFITAVAAVATGTTTTTATATASATASAELEKRAEIVQVEPFSSMQEGATFSQKKARDFGIGELFFWRNPNVFGDIRAHIVPLTAGQCRPDRNSRLDKYFHGAPLDED